MTRQPSAIQPSRTFHLNRRSRAVASFGVLASGAMGAVSWSLVKPEPLLGWPCVVFSLFCVVIFATAAVAESWLRLDSEGFELKGLGRLRKTRWQEVKAFRIKRAGRLGRVIAIEVHPPTAKVRLPSSIAAPFNGGEAIIGNNFKIPLDELERVLNAWLARYGKPVR